MRVAKDLHGKIADPALTPDERARLRCRLAKRSEEAGDYEGARRSMGDLWARVGERPEPGGLDRATRAEVLLRAGTLTGWIGGAKRIEGSQEIAKTLIGESVAIFAELGEEERVAEAETELAHCHWRQGDTGEARALLRRALGRLADNDCETKAAALIRSAMVERSANRLHDALRILAGAAAIFESCDSHALKGKFHLGFANVLTLLGETECREDYTDRALVEYEAAGHHFERAGHTLHHACAEKNLARLLLAAGRFPDAHERLDMAQALFTTLKDGERLAQVDEMRARVLMAEGRAAEAEKLARTAAATLEKGGGPSLLAETLTTHGLALLRTGRRERARLALRGALETARRAGDGEGAGRAALTAMEELWDYVSGEELRETYEAASELLASSRSAAAHRRLAACARRLLFLAHTQAAPPDWMNFSFKEALRRFEAGLIERALKDAGGSVTRAARLLGFKHHHSLASIINNRHRSLLSERRPVVQRRRSLIVGQPHAPAPAVCRRGAPRADVYLGRPGEVAALAGAGLRYFELDAGE